MYFKCFTTLLLLFAIAVGEDDIVFSGATIKWARWCNFEGQDLGKSYRFNSLQRDCASLCVNNPPCNIFQWQSLSNSFSDLGYCSLKRGSVSVYNAFASAQADEASTCGFLTTDDRQTIWEGNKNHKWSKGCDFRTSVGLYHVRSTVDNLMNLEERRRECRLYCEQNPPCTHWTFIDQGSVCMLRKGTVKQSDAIAEPNRNVSCGLLQLEWTVEEGVQQATGCYFNNDNYYDEFKTDDERRCRESCKENTYCSHYNWMQQDTTCQLKTCGSNFEHTALFGREAAGACGFVLD